MCDRGNSRQKAVVARKVQPPERWTWPAAMVSSRSTNVFFLLKIDAGSHSPTKYQRLAGREQLSGPIVFQVSDKR